MAGLPKVYGKRIILRLDVSPEVGFGHYLRCITLARVLRQRGALPSLLLRAREVDCAVLAADPISKQYLNWLCSPESDALALVQLAKREKAMVVVDHYRACENYQQILLQAAIPWLQFDWSAREPLWADWVLSPSPAASRNDYTRVVRRKKTVLLLGPQYAILRGEFAQATLRRRRSGSVNTVLLVMGGGDDRGALLQVVDAIPFLSSIVRDKISWIIISGGSNPRLPELRTRLAASNLADIRLMVDVEDMAREIARSDLAIISGGTVSYEMAALGCPALILAIADNQIPNATAWSRIGSAKYLGLAQEVTPEIIAAEIGRLCSKPQSLVAMSDKGMWAVDGLGAERVADILLRH